MKHHQVSDGFRRRLEAGWSQAAPDGARDLADGAVERLALHHRELSRWHDSTALVARRELDDIVERHYLESLLGSALLPQPPSALVDLGSGQGFPGLALAAIWPDVRVCLVEPRAKKVAFLRQTAHHMKLAHVTVQLSRFSQPSPSWWPSRDSVVTVRALKLEPSHWSALRDTLGDSGAVLRWETPLQEDPVGWTRRACLDLPGSRNRRISLYR